MKRTLCSVLVATIAALGFPGLVDAGSPDGPLGGVYRVEAKSMLWYSVQLSGGEWTRIELLGDGDTDLDLFVYDKAGNLLASDTDLSDWCIANFYVAQDQMVRIEVHNLGDVWNEFSIEVE